MQAHKNKIVFALLFITRSAFAQEAKIPVASATESAVNNAMLWVLIGVVIVLLVFILSMSKIIKNLIGSGYRDKNANGANKASIFFSIAVAVALLSSGSVFAQEGSYAIQNNYPLAKLPQTYSGLDATVFWLLIVTIVAEIGVLLFLYQTLQSLLRTLGYVEETKEESLINWDKLNNSLTGAVAIEEEASIMTNHEYDGIRELDNNLPPWWKYMFYLTITFSVIYLFNYHIASSSKLQLAEYEQELADAEIAKKEYLKNAAANVDENSVVLGSASDINEGKNIFTQNCVSCHAANGGGSVGPNLTDDYWLHGGGIKNIFKTIKYGVTTKGMIAWQAQLNPQQIQQVASYIVSIKGTNPAGAKAPQGDLYSENTSAATDSTTTSDSTKVSMK